MKDDAGFLQDIIAHPNDPVPRLIYADWLQEQDDLRGEFLRLEVQYRQASRRDPERKKFRELLKKLREGIDPGWLARLDRTRVENCGLRFQFECNRRWEELKTTDDARVRFCEGCNKEVHHCGSIGEANEKAQEGKCVAVDSRLDRSPGDVRAEPLVMLRLGMLRAPSPEPDRDRDDQLPGPVR